MAVRDDLFELDSVVIEMELAQEKAAAMSDDLRQDYFEVAENERKTVHLHYDTAGIKNRIASDYINQMGELIKTVRKLVNSAWDTTIAQERQKKAEDKEKSPQSPK